MSKARITKAELVESVIAARQDLEPSVIEGKTVKELKAWIEQDGIEILRAEQPEQPEQEEPEGSGEISADEVADAKTDALVEEGREKFEYLQDKDPSPKHEFYAALMSALSGIEITPKQYQVMICTHRYIQASDLNRVRKDYRPRTAESVIQAAATLQARAEELITDDAGAVISKGLNHIPEHLVELVASKLTPEATEDEVAEAIEAAEEELADA